MAVVGSAEIEILPLTAGFKSALDAETAPAFAHFSKTAETAGEKAGANLHKGFAKASAGITLAVGAAVAGMADLAVKQEKVTVSIANSERISTAAAHKISAAFLDTAGSALYSGRAIGEAFQP